MWTGLGLMRVVLLELNIEEMGCKNQNNVLKDTYTFQSRTTQLKIVLWAL